MVFAINQIGYKAEFVNINFVMLLVTGKGTGKILRIKDKIFQGG